MTDRTEFRPAPGWLQEQYWQLAEREVQLQLDREAFAAAAAAEGVTRVLAFRPEWIDNAITDEVQPLWPLDENGHMKQ